MPTDNTSRPVVLVTRPRHQTEELGALIVAMGAEVIHFPVLEIVSLPPAKATTELIDDLRSVDIVIFVSANAVEQGDARVRNQLGKWPAQLQFAVVGRSSARVLARVGLQANICPEHHFNTEALLALPTMQQVKNKRIVIFRGQGGREKLALELRRRGATVDYAEVYRRQRPNVDLSQLRQSGVLSRVGAIIIASNESLQNLYDMAASIDRDWLLNTPLAVISHRCAELADRLGFRHYNIASEASNQGLLEAVQQYIGKAPLAHPPESGNDRTR